jgi:hypothetical protein
MCVAKAPWPVLGGGGKMWAGREERGDLGVKVRTGGEEGGAGDEEKGGRRSGGVERRSCEIRLMGEVEF